MPCVDVVDRLGRADLLLFAFLLEQVNNLCCGGFGELIV